MKQCKFNITKEKREEIRKVYKKNLDLILKHHYVSPYFLDWIPMFTPIENNVWADIRYLCLPFYPQFPVDKYFIDFADPVLKIGIEVDGKHHLDQIEKDKERQDVLESLGWRIIRIQGWMTYFYKRTDEFGNIYDYSEAEEILKQLKRLEY